MLKSTFKINLILTLVLIFIAALGGYFIVGRALAPVERISRTAKIISKSSDLTRRINIGDGKDEIYSLANTFDDMLDRLEKNFEREKQFTSDASHELRTPVAVIMSECEYMSECAKTPDDFRESADSVKRQADKMSKLISELLTISRMDKKTMPLNFEETDISELLSFVCDEQEELFGTEIIMEREIAPEVFAKVDKSCIARLFINLISNAYRYSFDGGKISVKLSETNSEIVFSVKDNGIGIDEKEQEKIWERFYQVDTARTASGGVGLGLSMVKWIAENHGGKVSVASKPGEGSEFTVVLPKKHLITI